MTGKRRRIKGWVCTAFNNFSISVCTAIFGWLVFYLFLFGADLRPHAWEKVNMG